MIDWQRQEPGWYTSELGGICKEGDGWWLYPRSTVSILYGRDGPYKTLAEAKRRRSF